MARFDEFSVETAAISDLDPETVWRYAGDRESVEARKPGTTGPGALSAPFAHATWSTGCLS